MSKNKVEELNNYFDVIKKFLDKGLEMDEKNQPFTAYDYYIEALKVIDNALIIKFTENEM